MKRFYTNSGAKCAVFCLTMLLTICAVILTGTILNFASQGCIPGQRYENSMAYRTIATDYVISAANLYRMQGEDLSALSFVDQQERQSLLLGLEENLSADQSNFRFEIRTEDGGNTLYSNLAEGESFESLGIEPQYAAVRGGEMFIDFPADVRYYLTAASDHLFFNDTYLPDTGLSPTMYTVVSNAYFSSWSITYSDTYAELTSSSNDSYILCYGILPDYPVEDSLRTVHSWYLDMQNTFPVYIIGAALFAALALAGLILTCRGAGRRPNTDGVTLRLFDRIPFEFLLILGFLAAGIGYSVIEEFLYITDYYTSSWLFLVGGYLSYILILFELGILTTSVRLKARSFWRHTLIGRMVSLCTNIVNHLDLSWKFVLLYIVYEFISLVLFMPSNIPGVFFLLAILNFFLLLAVCRWAVKFAAVRAGAAELAKGNLEYRINTLRLPPLLKAHANDLNHISDGMAAAMEEQMKSERLKSELITNVSHDIKTPLTSIINYVDLIKAEHIDNPKVQEYIAVLDRQSARLKKLTNDLVDASKASSGTMQVHLEDVDACELLQQATGEYSERLAANKLTPVFSLPDQPVCIRADGALLWRVIDNLLSNICKYALPGTRVYMNAESDGARLTVSIKNISKAALNIPPDELMERFVRGDSSRNSEGSGLGLSIARSLTELMGGTFDLEIDGDLFKARFTFPVIVKLHG